MNCPNCGFYKTKVRRTNPRKKTNDTHRIRICLKCKHRFSTLEKIAVLKGDSNETKTRQFQKKHLR